MGMSHSEDSIDYDVIDPIHTCSQGPVCEFWSVPRVNNGSVTALLDDPTCGHESCYQIMYRSDPGTCEGCYDDWAAAQCPPDTRTQAEIDAENAWHDQEQARGELAYSPHEMECYKCLPVTGIVRKVMELGPVTRGFDPTQTYKLECGHFMI